MFYDDLTSPFVRCPYNGSHVMRRHRLPYHVRKCKSSFPEVKMEACSHNFLHFVSSDELESHLETCPCKFEIESSLDNKECHHEGECNVRLQDQDTSAADVMYYVRKELKERPKKGVAESELNESHKDIGELPPLPRPKTASKAFMPKKTTNSD